MTTIAALRSLLMAAACLLLSLVALLEGNVGGVIGLVCTVLSLAALVGLLTWQIRRDEND